MPILITHTNRRGEIYHLQQTLGKNGQPRCTLSRKLTGTPVTELPAGFEIYEAPETAQVFLRKVRATAILPLEVEAVRQAVRTQAKLEFFVVQAEGEEIVIYLADIDPDRHVDFLATLGPVSPTRARALRNEVAQAAPYVKMMRFVLMAPRKRFFHVDRWCFLGGIDNWYFLSGPAPLARLLDQYAKHLGQESFFELM